MTETTTATCERCGERCDAEQVARGWPIVTDDGLCCASCYGDDAWCPEGHVLPADVDSDDCPSCADPAGELVAEPVACACTLCGDHAPDGEVRSHGVSGVDICEGCWDDTDLTGEGDYACSRQMDDGSRCRCGERISWGSIHTGRLYDRGDGEVGLAPGANRRYGDCQGCGAEYVWVERGGWYFEGIALREHEG